MSVTDAELMRAVCQGDFQQFAELVTRHQSALFRVARSRLWDIHLAEDAVQETFLRVFRSRHSYNAQLPFRAWLWTVHTHVCQRLGKNRQRSGPVCEIRGADQRVTTDSNQEQLLLSELLDRLPEIQADTIRLRFFGNLTFEEIAAVQQIPLATAKSRVRLALEKLNQLLSQADEKSVQKES